MNQSRHHRHPPKVEIDPTKPCTSCVHCRTSDAAIIIMNCHLNPSQPQLISFQRSSRGECGASGKHHKLPPVRNVWAKIKAHLVEKWWARIRLFLNSEVR